jgi:hypothetical protein
MAKHSNAPEVDFLRSRREREGAGTARGQNFSAGYAHPRPPVFGACSIRLEPIAIFPERAQSIRSASQASEEWCNINEIELASLQLA